MRHFPDETWIDFVRGIASSGGAAELERHLDKCAECKETYRLWSAVFEVVHREEKYSPGGNATRRVKAMYGLRYAREPSVQTKARLVFDSFRPPLAEAVRSSPITARRDLQYELGPMLIDIELSKESGGSENSTLLSGQISSRDDTTDVSNCRVFLVRGRGFTAQTKCSRLGEFHFDFTGGNNWKLLIQSEAQEIIRLSLPDMTSRPAKK